MLYQSASVCNFDIPLLSAHLMSQSILSVQVLYESSVPSPCDSLYFDRFYTFTLPSRSKLVSYQLISMDSYGE